MIKNIVLLKHQEFKQVLIILLVVKMGARFLQHPLNSVTNDLMELILQYDMIKNVWF